MDSELAKCLEAVRPQLSAHLIRPYAPRLMDSVIPHTLATTTNTRLKVSSLPSPPPARASDI
jgi:hypothetical protein